MVAKRKTWFLTYPQNDGSKDDLVAHLHTIDTVVEYVVAAEKHADGANHLHAYVKFESGITPPNSKVFDFNKHGNYQPCRSCKAVIKYCKKGGDFISSFDLDSYLKKKGKVDAELIKTKSVKQALIDEDITHYAIRTYQLARSILVDSYTHTDVRGFWFFGPPGCGKSHKARTENPDSYIKAQNKWWDGYDGQKTVILDDLDKGAYGLGHYLKIWADKWPCKGEVKGAQVELVHTKFIVTSNFAISSIWDPEEEPEMYQAISRRFKLCTFPAMFTRSPTSVGDNRMTFKLDQL